jgi:hypothetical protein
LHFQDTSTRFEMPVQPAGLLGIECWTGQAGESIEEIMIGSWAIRRALDERHL